jgi:hypothetical protein
MPTTFATTLLTVLLAAPAPQSATLQSHVTLPERLTVGDRFEETVVLTLPAAAIVNGPLADSLGVFALAGARQSTKVRDGMAHTTYHLSLAGFEPGTHVLPPFTFLVQATGRTDTLRSDTATVTIASVLPKDMKDIHGLKPAESFPNYALWLWPGALLLLLVLAWAARRLYRRLRHGDEAAAPPLPPWEEALGALDAMPLSEWLEGGQWKRYYYALSEVLKRYIGRRFEFDAVEQTTTEILAALRARRAPLRDDVARFLLSSDLVKYSKVIPPLEEARAAIEQVRGFVLRTRPVEPAPAQPTAETALAAAAPPGTGT